MISPVFWTASRKFAFQMVGNVYRLYNHMGDWLQDFKSFEGLCDYITINDR